MSGSGRKLTYDDYALIPYDGLRHEIIDGQHFASPACTPRHQRVSIELSMRLYSVVEKHQLGEVLAAPLDVLLSEHDILQPDILFISNERASVVTEENIQGAPDLIIEIVSEITRDRDERIKLARYELLGVSEYWIVDPLADRVHVFQAEEEMFRKVAELAAGDVLTTPLLPGLEIPLRELFK